MWPFRKKAPEVTTVDEFHEAKDRAIELMYRLDAGDTSISDDEVREVYRELANRMQSNCDSVAQGLLVVIVSLCASRNHLTAEFLPDAMEALYSLAIEEYAGFERYFNWLADYDDAYLGKPTPSGRTYLLNIASSEETIREAFEVMYRKQDRDGRDSDEDNESLPAILTSSGNEQAGASS
ncbi:MAG: hypothetical protein AAGC68_10875 [Verrucomicrobiota bacterium]